ncbi:hypothetical protein [Bathymodiolus platifrons methanotrophic gill symbiont]|nr:hypothetical protein [Bathymodiolus platifrons methanotrophic gill symbiont]
MEPYKLKDSGVEWLGNIPAHWKIDRLAGSRYFCESLFWASQPKQAAKT